MLHPAAKPFNFYAAKRLTFLMLATPNRVRFTAENLLLVLTIAPEH